MRSGVRGAVAGVAIALPLAAGALAAAAPAAGGGAEGRPVVHSAQFENALNWSCHPQKSSAGGTSKKHKRFTFGSGGARFYTLKWKVLAIRCKGRTKLIYYPYIDASSLPDSRHVTFYFQSAGKHKKWRTQCGRSGKSKRCLYQVKGGKKFPIPVSQPFVQYRGKGVIRYARITHFAEEGDSYVGHQIDSKPQRLQMKLRYKRNPRRLW